MPFHNVPVTRAVVALTVAGATLASLLDSKHYFFILINEHIWWYKQLWRILSFQLCYNNSSEVLFAAMTLASMRVIEQHWGSRKYATFLITSYLGTSIITAGLFIFGLRPLSWGAFNYIPAGPTAVVFSVLAQYYATVPTTYAYRIATSQAPPTNERFRGITLSDKTLRYIVALELAVMQTPASLITAAVGWVFGMAWRSDFLPAKVTNWRVPAWVVGEKEKPKSDGFENLRRRLEDDSPAAASSSGTEPRAQGQASRRWPAGEEVGAASSGAG